jgi:hypothetical protein
MRDFATILWLTLKLLALKKVKRNIEQLEPAVIYKMLNSFENISKVYNAIQYTLTSDVR